jgi:hypothetical protein
MAITLGMNLFICLFFSVHTEQLLTFGKNQYCLTEATAITYNRVLLNFYPTKKVDLPAPFTPAINV